MFVTSGGRVLQTLDDWIRARGFLPWPRSGRLLGTRWLSAQGIPPEFEAALQRAPFAPVHLDRAVVGHHGSAPGVAGHCGELVLLGTTGDRANILIAVDGRVGGAFQDPESTWRIRGGSPAEPRGERRIRASEELRVEPRGVPPSGWPLVYRACAVVAEAERQSCDRGMVAVHSFSPDGRDAGFAEFRSLFEQLGGEPPQANVPARLGRFRTVELWWLWVADRAGG